MLENFNGHVVIVDTSFKKNGQSIIQVSADKTNRRATVHAEAPSGPPAATPAVVFIEDTRGAARSNVRKLGEFPLATALSLAKMWVASGTTPSRITIALLDASKR